MPDERCPWCGAEARRPQYGNYFWACYTKVGGEEADRSSPCLRREKDQIAARVTRLESALRTIADTHGPGTIAGDAARNALEEVTPR
jgi:hypothetical protein